MNKWNEFLIYSGPTIGAVFLFCLMKRFMGIFLSDDAATVDADYLSINVREQIKLQVAL